jgi:hypothetical protein
MNRGLRDSLGVAIAALFARTCAALWAADRFQPVGDAVYYARIAARIADGRGYTWLWPDGSVTFAAHYPVGYPAALGALYALFGVGLWPAMAFNAAVGAVAAVAVHRLALRARAGRGAALLAGGLVAFHPGLVAYTPALMTEGVTASLAALAVLSAARARDSDTHGPPSFGRALLPYAALGGVVGIATLVRPQSVVLAPLLSLCAALGAGADRSASASRWGRLGPPSDALARIATTCVSALLVCAPWTARNCVRMGRCALVSVNGGWNLLIGADRGATGAWAPVEVPEPCRTVWDEAAKDTCFREAALRLIADRPFTWLALVPKKLAATFDYAGAAGWYLHASNPEVFGARAKLALGAVETLYERAVLALALAWAAWGRPGEPRGVVRARLGLAVAGALSLFWVHAWIGYAAFVAVAVLRGRDLVRGPVLGSGAAALVFATAATHAVFFGSGRYALVTFPLLSGTAALGVARFWGRERQEGPSGSRL